MYMSTKMLLDAYLVRNGDWVWTRRKRAALDVWQGWLVALLSLEHGCEEVPRLLNSGKRYWLTEKQCPSQFWHNGFEVKERGSSGCFVIATGNEQSSLLLSPLLQTYMFHPRKKQDDLAGSSHLEKIQMQPNSVFVGHGYLKQAVPGWNSNHVLWYHIYVKENDRKLKDAVAFTYSSSLNPRFWKVPRNQARKGVCLEDNLTTKDQTSNRQTNRSWRDLTYLTHRTCGVV